MVILVNNDNDEMPLGPAKTCIGAFARPNQYLIRLFRLNETEEESDFLFLVYHV